VVSPQPIRSRRKIGWSAPLTGTEVTGLAKEQAALRRVATLVARGVPAEELFSAVTEEVGRVLSTEFVHLIRYEPDDAATALAAFGTGPILPAGTRLQLGGNNVTTLVFETRRSARIDDYGDASGPFADIARDREARLQSSVGTPIVVEASLWGVMVVGCSEEQSLPADTEARLADFTELVATAIANAESRARLAQLAEERDALRRVATLVARGVAPEQVFAAVTEEVARLLVAEMSNMARYEPDGAFTIVGSVGVLREHWPVGSRWPLGGNNTTTLVFETARPARIQISDEGTGEHLERVREVGLRSGVAVPIIVEGRLWGVIGVATTRAKPLPADTEARLGSFTELVATAIANAESRAELARLAEQQAALRRVATLVAEGVPPEELFAAVADEIVNVLPVRGARIGRYESDGTVTCVATITEPGAAEALAAFRLIPAGKNLRLGGNNLATVVFETGRPAHLELDDASGPIVAGIREFGGGSGVGTPIVVDGRLWGLATAGSTVERPLPPDTEARLTDFTELVATAIANAESRAGLARLAGEQAALRRVATLVAEGAPPTAVFDAVAAEMATLLDADGITLVRYEPGDELTVLAHRGLSAGQLPAGTRVRHDGSSVSDTIRRTQRPARMASYADTQGHIGEVIGDLRFHSGVGAPIVVDGRLWGATIANWTAEEPPPPGTEQRLAEFARLLDTAIANADGRDQLTASRARLVTEAHEARRRVVRDLHDGAQQGLVHTIITLKLAHRALDAGEQDLGPLVSEALQYAETANDELRELVHGILPSVLTREGLRAGVDELAARMSIPVEIDIEVDRLPPVVEATAYFVVAGALTNVLKHAHAEHAEVRAFVKHETLYLEVRDDGVGGADPGGHGVVGLSDRVTALDGRLSVESPAEGGTILAATLSLDSK
jgi:GAF domain-containing protein